MKYPFPKVDLHFHLDGSMVPEVTWKLARERNIKLPGETLEGFKQHLVETADCGDLGEYLARFDLSTAILQDETALEETIYTTIENVKDYLCYAEIRFAPQLHTRKGLSQREVIEAVIKGKKRAEKDFPAIRVGIILCCMIADYDNSEENFETVRLFEEYCNYRDIVALDLAGHEDLVPMSHYAPLFVSPKAKGLPMTIHAGDDGKPENCSLVIDFGATRIGHGHKCYYNKEVLQKVIDTKTTLEICLTSNVQCKTQPSYQEHPAKRLLDAGVKVTLNTDNMILGNLTLLEEYDKALSEAGFTYNDLITCNINSIEAAFMPEEDKPPYIAELKKYYR
ncbi:MAG TPA: adenosine deaminase [Erysipelotrichaceae bacterium]|nr:adenosine deaminase [Erysipelotrichaceae bacterium]